MKFMENAKLEMIENKVRFENEVLVITARLELYSCKMIRRDRKLLKYHCGENFEEISYYENDVSLNRSSASRESEKAFSPLSTSILLSQHKPGNLDELNAFKTHMEKRCGEDVMVSDQKTLCSLRAILYYSYDDYSLLEIPGTSFLFINDLDIIIADIKSSFVQSTGKDFDMEIFEELWQVQDDEIEFKDCEKYQYAPTGDDTYIMEDLNNIWRYNYFFYNRKKKQILYLNIKADRIENVCSQEYLYKFEE